MWPQLLEQVTDAEACAFIHRRAGLSEILLLLSLDIYELTCLVFLLHHFSMIT